MNLFFEPIGNFLRYLSSSPEYIFLTFILLGELCIIPIFNFRLNMEAFYGEGEKHWGYYAICAGCDIAILLLGPIMLLLTGAITVEQMINYFSGVRC